MSEWASVHADRFSGAEDDADEVAECERCGDVVFTTDLWELSADGADQLVCWSCLQAYERREAVQA